MYPSRQAPTNWAIISKLELLTNISETPTAVTEAHNVMPTPWPIPVAMPCNLPSETVLLTTAARLGPGDTAPRTQMNTICSQLIKSKYTPNLEALLIADIVTKRL